MGIQDQILAQVIGLRGEQSATAEAVNSVKDDVREIRSQAEDARRESSDNYSVLDGRISELEDSVTKQLEEMREVIKACPRHTSNDLVQIRTPSPQEVEARRSFWRRVIGAILSLMGIGGGGYWVGKG